MEKHDYSFLIFATLMLLAIGFSIGAATHLDVYLELLYSDLLEEEQYELFAYDSDNCRTVVGKNADGDLAVFHVTIEESKHEHP